MDGDPYPSTDASEVPTLVGATSPSSPDLYQVILTLI